MDTEPEEHNEKNFPSPLFSVSPTHDHYSLAMVAKRGLPNTVHVYSVGYSPDLETKLYVYGDFLRQIVGRLDCKITIEALASRRSP